jgi:hypothetical protein
MKALTIGQTTYARYFASIGALNIRDIRGARDEPRGSVDVRPATPSAAARGQRRAPFEQLRSATG